MAPETLLRAMYDAFNRRDIDAVIAHMTEDVHWPNAWEGGRVRGHDELRDYWTRQWSAIDPRVEPIGFTPEPDGRVAVEVHQVVRDKDGTVLVDANVQHVYRFRDGLIARMDLADAAE